MKNGLQNNDGFTFVGIIIAVIIVIVLITMQMSQPTVGLNKETGENVMEVKTIASTIYNSAKVYIATQQAAGNSIAPNSKLDPSNLTGGLDTSNLKTIEVKVDGNGSGIKYVYVETNKGTKADFPVGASGKT